MVERKEKNSRLLGEKFIIGGAQLYSRVFNEYNLL